VRRAADQVTRALAAFESGDGQTALDLLLERWRATRSPRLRRAITLLSQRLERPPIAGGTRERRFLEWRAIARAEESPDVPRLIASLTTLGSREAELLLRDVDSWGPDPRVATSLADLLSKPPPGFVGLKARPFWDHALELVAVHADVSHLDDVEQLDSACAGVVRDSEALARHLRAGLARVAEAIRAAKHGRGIGADEVDACDRLVRLLEAERQRTIDDRASIDALFAAVYEEPASDERRMVLADALEAVGDPRGEFISLQLADARGEMSARARAREKRLLEAYGRRWLGGIERAVMPTSELYRRGFATLVRVEFVSPAAWSEALGCLEWATVESVVFAGTLGVDPVALLQAPQLRALKSAAGVPSAVFASKRSIAIEWLGVADLPRFDLVASCEVLPRLRCLSVEVPLPNPEPLRCLWAEGALGRQLEALIVQTEGWAAWFEGAREMPLSTLVLRDGWDLSVTISADAAGRLSAVEIGAASSSALPRLVEGLVGADLTAVTSVTMSKGLAAGSDVDRLRRLFARADVKVT
jgi:uncharacterized protein (TIGR02996 family)